jgi:alkane 1-monooxygenase
MKKPAYLMVYLIPITVLVSFQLSGLLSLLPLFIFFGLVPLLELLLKPNHSNLDITIDRGKSNYFDWILYLAVPVQFAVLIYFLVYMANGTFTPLEYIGHTFSMGIMCGVFGINIAHELGHRVNRVEQGLAQIMLLTSLEMHFMPYHNQGHHYNVATPNDPATARKGESVFVFWFRSQIGSYFEAWQIEEKRIVKKDGRKSLLKNRVFQYTVIQYTLLFVIYFFLGLTALLCFLGAAFIGILLLETVNYIEHYGLLREQKENGRYERVKPWHSWNSDHPLGRAMLFELSRHSDHHYKASKKYQILESHPDNPQMPTGYPGMMLLSTIPPLWFKVMNKRLSSI